MPDPQRAHLRTRLIGGLILLAATGISTPPEPLAAQGLVAKGFRVGVSRAVYMDRLGVFNEGAAEHQVSVQAGGLWTFWMAGGRLAFQPEALAVYSRYGLDLVVDENFTTGQTQRFDFGDASASRFELNVPLLFKLNANRAGGALVSVYLGPIVGFGFGSNPSAPAGAGELDWDAALGPLELGGLTGIGFGFERYVIDLRVSFVGPDADVMWTPPSEDAACCIYLGINPSFDLSASFAILW